VAPLDAPDFRLSSHAGRLMAAWSRFGQSMAVLGKTLNLSGG
jgi:hypothetical protein